MKRMILIVSLLLVLSLACSLLPGGGNDTNTSGTEDNNMPSGAPAEDVTSPDAGDDMEEEPPAPAPMSDSPCYNPFYPLALGESYTYLLTYSDPMSADPNQVETAEFKIVSVGETEDTLTVQTVFDDFSSEVNWICGADGLFSVEFAQFNVRQLSDVEIETISYDGITLPVESMWNIGYSWPLDYEINMSFSVQGLSVNSHVITTMTSEITAIESVTVPAGTYPEAYRVETNGTITTETGVEGNMVPVDAPLVFVSWYVKGVGMVKQDASNVETGTNLTELIAVE